MIERSFKPVPNQNTASRRPEKENWEDLWRIGPGTPMGTIMREYWQPAVLSEEVAKGKALPVKLLGESFTVYRGEDDSVHAVARHCPHRGTRLDVGWVEGNQIRCGYHGWRFDGTGQCTEMPAELESFAQKVQIPAYPAYEYGGIIYVYMGEGEAPEFPRKYEIDNAKLLWSYRDMWPCNWLQTKENSFDPLHVVFVHRVGFGAFLSAGIPKIEFTETEWGFACKAVRPNDERIVETYFPNGTHVIVPQPNDFHAPWIDLFVCAVPIDDEHMAFMGTYASPIDGPEADELRRFFARRPFDSMEHEDEIYKGVFPENSMELIRAQDYAVQVGQGVIADRSHEWLGSSDVAIIQFRRALMREVLVVKNGDRHVRWKNRYGPADLPVAPDVKKRW